MPKPEFIGLDTRYSTADGSARRRVHLDGAGSPLAAKTALQTIEKVLPHYSNTHSYVHASAHITTQAVNWAHDEILRVLGARQDDYTVIFTGSGTTAGINRVARGLAAARENKKVVLVSGMEHHANDLPHRQFGNQVEYIPLRGDGALQGEIDLQELETLLRRYKGEVNYVAFSAVSNVTGILNPVAEITRLAHQFDALVLVDAAQYVAHQPTALSQQNGAAEVDFYCFSGHKLYCPASPGVLVAKKSILQQLSGQDLGGGSVEAVSYFDFQLLADYPEREQSGTPNIVGAIALAAVMSELDQFGFDNIADHDRALMRELYEAMSTLPRITLYGAENAERVGALAFNHEDIDHGLLAAILNDYYAIAVRNECFCAHPYVSSMMKQTLWQLDLDDIPNDRQQAYINRKRGMVRASLSLYNSTEDIEALIAALTEIGHRYSSLLDQYEPLDDGSWIHKEFKLDWREHLALAAGKQE